MPYLHFIDGRNERFVNGIPCFVFDGKIRTRYGNGVIADFYCALGCRLASVLRCNEYNGGS